MSSLSLGSSEALSTASAITLISFSLLSLEMQSCSEVAPFSYAVISYKFLLRVLVSDSLIEYSLAQNSGETSTFVRAFQT